MRTFRCLSFGRVDDENDEFRMNEIQQRLKSLTFENHSPALSAILYLLKIISFLETVATE